MIKSICQGERYTDNKPSGIEINIPIERRWEKKGVFDMTTKKEFTRVNINLPNNLINKVKEYANSLGINVTTAYIILINQALEQKDMLSKLPVLMTMIEEAKSLNTNSNEPFDLTQK